MPAEQPAQRTPVTIAQMKVALTEAWGLAFGADLPARPGSICVLLAHWALETGRGAHMMNFNVGNIKHAARDGRDWTYFATEEMLVDTVARRLVTQDPVHCKIQREAHGQTIVLFLPKHSGCAFRSFPTLTAGCTDYLQMLSKHPRFQHAWPAVLAGDPRQFSHLLRLNGYYTGPETSYTRTMCALFDEFSKQTVAA